MGQPVWGTGTKRYQERRGMKKGAYATHTDDDDRTYDLSGGPPNPRANRRRRSERVEWDDPTATEALSTHDRLATVNALRVGLGCEPYKDMAELAAAEGGYKVPEYNDEKLVNLANRAKLTRRAGPSELAAVNRQVLDHGPALCPVCHKMNGRPRVALRALGFGGLHVDCVDEAIAYITGADDLEDRALKALAETMEDSQ